jgi:hypothetical protein
VMAEYTNHYGEQRCDKHRWAHLTARVLAVWLLASRFSLVQKLLLPLPHASSYIQGALRA